MKPKQIAAAAYTIKLSGNYLENIIVLLALLAMLPGLHAQPTPATSEWNKAFGGTIDNRLYSMVATTDGGYILAGLTNSEDGDVSEPGFGMTDYWIIKIDKAGKKQWNKRFGGREEDDLTTIVALRDGGYILGGNSNSEATGNKTAKSKGYYDYWIIKIDSAGNKVWDRSFGGHSYDALSSIVVEEDGGFLLAGVSASDRGVDKSEPSKGSYDYWIIKVDANGIKEWDKTLGGNNTDELKSTVRVPGGGYFLGGTSISPKGADKTGESRGETDYWVVKIDEQGGKEWDRTLGGNYREALRQVLVTPEGNFLVGGQSQSGTSIDKSRPGNGSEDFWIVELDKEGNKRWDNSFGGSNQEVLSAMVTTQDGNYLLGGTSNSPADGNKYAENRGNIQPDYWVMLMGKDGFKKWDKAYGSPFGDYLTSMVMSQNSFLLGGISSTAVGADKTEAGLGANNFWVIKRNFNERKRDQTIVFDSIADRFFSTAPFTLQATASSTLPVSFKVIAGPAGLTWA